MRENVTLSTGRIVAHKPYLVNGSPTGATEAFILEHFTICGYQIEKHSEMSELEWIEYCTIIQGEKQ